jgi:hypothetical protein
VIRYYGPLLPWPNHLVAHLLDRRCRGRCGAFVSPEQSRCARCAPPTSRPRRVLLYLTHVKNAVRRGDPPAKVAASALADAFAELGEVRDRLEELSVIVENSAPFLPNLRASLDAAIEELASSPLVRRFEELCEAAIIDCARVGIFHRKRALQNAELDFERLARIASRNHDGQGLARALADSGYARRRAGRTPNSDPTDTLDEQVGDSAPG